MKKTDPNDARNLALYLEKDLLPELRMKDKTQAQPASLTQTRDTLVKLRTSLKNRLNNILSAHGINRLNQRITKRGSKLGRTALVQCALIAQRYSPYLKRYCERIKAWRGTGKAIIALARNLLGVYRTLKNRWVFEDFPTFVWAEPV